MSSTTLLTTAIMKTDISGSTARFRALPEGDLRAFLSEHRDFVARVAAAHGGRIVKPEGDGFWIVFPSVTATARAATTMQEELRLGQPGKGENRLAMRIVITLGDVFYEDTALVGDAVVLAARIEAITPPDEIYLSAAAWLAANPAEVRLASVGQFPLKGFAEPVPVYRVEQTHRTRVLADPYVVVTDLRGFSALAEASLGEAEKILNRLFELVAGVCRDFRGTNRFGAAEAYCLTFPEPELALAAVTRLVEEWSAFEGREEFRCAMRVTVHKGVLYAFRSYMYGSALSVAAAVAAMTDPVSPAGSSILVTGPVRHDLAGTPWGKRFEPVEVRTRSVEIEVFRLRT